MALTIEIESFGTIMNVFELYNCVAGDVDSIFLDSSKKD